MFDTGMVIVYDEDWAGFYNNGRLESSGDFYIVEEYVFGLLGVKVRSSEVLIDPKTRDAWPTIEQLDTAEERDQLERDEIDRLHKEAEEAERRYRDRKDS